MNKAKNTRLIVFMKQNVEIFWNDQITKGIILQLYVFVN
jgi:hypothetical protein